jgi:hypothetical protein
LPSSNRPPGGPHPEGSAPTIYERWIATFCGKQVAFLIALWPASIGGTMIRVGYPFP